MPSVVGEDVLGDAALSPAPLALAAEKRVHVHTHLFCHRYRFVMLVLCLLCLGVIYSNMLLINFTLICMEPKSSNASGGMSPANVHNHPIHIYTKNEKTIIQWTVAVSSMVAALPFSWMCTRYGAHYTFFASGIASGLATGMIPFATNLGFTALIVARVFQGLAYAMDFAVIGVLCTRWAPLSENARFIGVMTCFPSLSTFFSNILSGMICESSLGWPWTFYFHSIASLIFFTAWVLLYTDDPFHNPFVSSIELGIIHRDKTETHKFHEPYVPYAEICKDKVVWAVWLSSFADLFSAFFLYIYGPTYTYYILNFDAKETGIFGSLAAVSHAPVKMICSYISDKYHCMRERYKMWFFNSVALLAPAAIYVYLCFGPDRLIVVTLFGAVHAALGFNCGGFYKCGALISRQYAEFVVASTQYIKCAVFFVAPALVAIFVNDERDPSQWHIIFYMITASLVISNVVFCVYATDEARPFTHITAANRPAGKTSIKV